MLRSSLPSILLLLSASPAAAQYLETTPATVVDSESIELGYRAFSTDAEAARETGVVGGIAPGFDFGVTAPRPVFPDQQAESDEAQIAFRHLLFAAADDGPSLMLATGGRAARPLDEAPVLTLAFSHTTRTLAWHSNIGLDGELFAVTRVEGPLFWRVRPALELRQKALALEAVGLGALIQVSERIAFDAGTRFTRETSAASFGAGLTYVLPNQSSSR